MVLSAVEGARWHFLLGVAGCPSECAGLAAPPRRSSPRALDRADRENLLKEANPRDKCLCLLGT